MILAALVELLFRVFGFVHYTFTQTISADDDLFTLPPGLTWEEVFADNRPTKTTPDASRIPSPTVPGGTVDSATAFHFLVLTTAVAIIAVHALVSRRKRVDSAEISKVDALLISGVAASLDSASVEGEHAQFYLAEPTTKEVVIEVSIDIPSEAIEEPTEEKVEVVPEAALKEVLEAETEVAPEVEVKETPEVEIVELDDAISEVRYSARNVLDCY